MAMREHSSEQFRPLIFGEILYDCFPDGARILGGAPFNVAWHLRGFGVDPLLLSRVGLDAAGASALEQLHKWGLDTSLIQIDQNHPTGTATITPGNGQHSFDITADQAYDYVDYMIAEDALRSQDVSLLYYGTLAARSAISRTTLHCLRETLTVPNFIDINLRAPWWHEDAVHALIRDAAWVKLNEDELHALMPHEAADTSVPRQFAEDHHIAQLLVTRGESGAILVEGTTVYECPAPSIDGVVDTVGAGDAFSAVMLYGLSRQWSLLRSLHNAAEFAAAICMQRGAIINSRIFYEGFINRWED